MLRKVRYVIPQVAEANPPQPMDVAGEGLLYDESILRVNQVYKAGLHITTIRHHEGSVCIR